MAMSGEAIGALVGQIGSSLLSAGGNVFAGLLGKKNIESTNAANAQNIQKTNQANIDIANRTNAMNQQITDSTNQMNKAIQDSVNLTNKNIAEQNLAFQRENLDYQKALQQEIFNREDTAYERTAQDMANAGLNPLSMNGTNSAGEAIQTNPLNNSFQAQGYTAQGSQAQLPASMQAFQKQMIGFDWLANTVSGINDDVQSMLNHGIQLDSLNELKKNNQVDRFLKMREAGYIADDTIRPKNYVFKIPTNKDWKGDFVYDEYFNPDNKYMFDAFNAGRNERYDSAYGIYNNTPDFVKNIVGVQQELKMGRIQNIADSLTEEALKMYKKFF